MKKLILIPLFVSLSSFAQVQEIATKSEGTAIVAQIKDIEMKDMLEKTKEFKECRDKNKFDKDGKTSSASIKAAQECFRKQLTDSKDPDKLKKLADALNLQSYGLVKSHTNKDIQEYLNNKMYKSLTGVDPEEKNEKALIESMKFSKKKHIDQALFIRLYKTQLSKNALFEISRFCFEDLRVIANKSDKKTFGEHWADYKKHVDQKEGVFTISAVDDLGDPPFGTPVSDPSKKEEIYQNLFKSINITDATGLKSEDLNQFFQICGKTMVKLCDEFKKTSAVKDNIENTQTKVDEGKTTGSVGAASCLAKSRIQDLKKAIADTSKVEESFNDIQENEKMVSLMLKGEPAKIFTPGKDGAETLDNLTNYTTADMIEGGLNANAQDKYKECDQYPDRPQCAGLFGEEEKFNKAKHDLEMQMTAKREVEMARVRALKGKDEAKLKEYLEQNGFFNLLKDDQYLKMDEKQLSEAIGAEYEAKKIATLEEMNQKMGKRQVKKDASEKDKKDKVADIMDGTKQERARLAQVVMFNNIITSHLTLTRKGEKDPIGRNVNAWKKEEEALNKAKVDASLFANLKATDDGKGGGKGIGDDEQIGGIQFIDSILGKSEEKPK